MITHPKLRYFLLISLISCIVDGNITSGNTSSFSGNFRALRTLRDSRGVEWSEFFDRNTNHFYYFCPKTGESSWSITLPAVTDPLARRDKGDASWLYPVQHEKRDENVMHNLKLPTDKRPKVHVDDRKTKNPLPLVPVDSEVLHLLQDPAGKLRNLKFKTIFDSLPGMMARKTFPIRLQAPTDVHYFFYDADTKG